MGADDAAATGWQGKLGGDAAEAAPALSPAEDDVTGAADAQLLARLQHKNAALQVELRDADKRVAGAAAVQVMVGLVPVQSRVHVSSWQMQYPGMARFGCRGAVPAAALQCSILAVCLAS